MAITGRVLITGGAGFIGSHLADRLLSAGHQVRVLDAYDEQVHADGATSGHLSDEVEVIKGDVRDPRAVRDALHDVNAVYHFAAAVGVGQSMYEVRHYVDVNDVGTAVLVEQMSKRPPQRLVVASSMSVYGEGLYETRGGDTVEDARREPARLRRGEWDPVDGDGAGLTPIATPETKRPDLASVYALSKYDQERLALIAGSAYDIPTTALRFFNVYGPRQALSNPYTGVLAIFASRILNGHAPLVYEDGEQRRDFVSVHDVARACELALDAPDSIGEVINIGSGEHRSVREVARRMTDAMGRRDIEAEVSGKWRVGDVRHCFADITKAREMLGYKPRVSFEDGLAELVEWLAEQKPEDGFDDHRADLARRGLVV